MSHPPITPSPHELIRASAGSGKTYKLTTRYLDLLHRGAQPENILATTFTRKAAGEILGRILMRLAQATQDKKAREQLSIDLASQTTLTQTQVNNHLDTLIQKLHRLSIYTMDSFFNRMVQAFHMNLGLSDNVQLVDDRSSRISQLRLDAINQMLYESMNANENGLQEMIELLRSVHFDQAKRSVTDALTELFTNLYDIYREAPIRSLWNQLRIPKRLNDDELAQTIQAFEASQTNLPKTKQGKQNSHFVKAYNNCAQMIYQSDWESLASNAFASSMQKDEPFHYKQPVNDDLVQSLRKLHTHAGAYVLQGIARQTTATFDLLHRFDRHFQQAKRENNVLCFSDLTYLLLKQLEQDDSTFILDLYFRMDQRVRHMLIDEFQDTSLSQWQLLKPFVDEITDESANDRSLFCVGDTKQSIYGWRGGVPELFDAVESLYSNLIPTTMNTSYRSSQVVLDAVNTLFLGLPNLTLLEKIDEKYPGDVQAIETWSNDFEKHTANTPQPGYVCVETTRPETPQHGEEENDSDNITDDFDDGKAIAYAGSPHIQFVADRIKQLTEQHPGKSLGVLVRRRTCAGAIIFALRQKGIAVSAEGATTLLDSPAVTAVLAAMELAQHPAHRTAAFHVTNSPVGVMLGMTHATTTQCENISRRIRTELIEHGYGATLARWTVQLASSCHAQNLHRLSQLAKLAQAYDQIGGSPCQPGQFVAYIRQEAMTDVTNEPVRVMTIHASKGLEFDMVVMPELDGSFLSRMQAMSMREGVTGPVREVHRCPKAEIRAMSDQLSNAYAQTRAMMRKEWLCTLYVAMTRAKHALYMYVQPRKWHNGKIGSLTDCPASVVRELLCNQGHDENELLPPDNEQLVLYEAGDANWSRTNPQATTKPATSSTKQILQLEPLKTTLTSKPHTARRHFARQSPSQLKLRKTVKGAELLHVQGVKGRQRGTIIHAWFEKVGFVDEPNSIPSDDQLKTLAYQDAPAIDAKELSTWIAAFRQTLQVPAIHNLLARNDAFILWQERIIQSLQNDSLFTAMLDRVSLWRDDAGNFTRAQIVDFKTDVVDDADILREKYAAQLNAYKDILARVTNLSPDAITCHLLSTHLQTVVDL